MTASTLFLKIANFTIGLKFLKTEFPFWLEKTTRERYKYFYPGFIFEKKGKVDFWVEFIQQTSFEVIIKEKQKSFYINYYKQVGKNKIITYYHISDTQFQIILRNILQNLLESNQGIILHASASLINNKACIFLGRSGSGKSTSVQLLSQEFNTLADDSVILRKESGIFNFYQTPLFEKNILIKKYSKKHKLGGLFFLKKSKLLKVEKIQDKEIITQKLIEQFLTNKEALKKQLPLLMDLAVNFDHFYKLEFGLKEVSKMVELLKNYDKI